MPYWIKTTLQVSLIMDIKRYWKWRHDPYWRKSIREWVEAYRYLKDQ
jgi:hypothetical protein